MMMMMSSILKPIQEAIKQGRWAVVLRLSEEILKSDPSNFQVILIAGKAYIRNGLFREAEEMFRNAISLHPERREGWQGLVEILQKCPKQRGPDFESILSSAIQTMKKDLSSLKPSVLKTWFHMVSTYTDLLVKNGKLDEACDVWENDVLPKCSSPVDDRWIALGKSCALQKREAKERQIMDKKIEEATIRKIGEGKGVKEFDEIRAQFEARQEIEEMFFSRTRMDPDYEAIIKLHVREGTPVHIRWIRRLLARRNAKEKREGEEVKELKEQEIAADQQRIYTSCAELAHADMYCREAREWLLLQSEGDGTEGVAFFTVDDFIRLFPDSKFALAHALIKCGAWEETETTLRLEECLRDMSMTPYIGVEEEYSCVQWSVVGWMSLMKMFAQQNRPKEVLRIGKDFAKCVRIRKSWGERFAQFEEEVDQLIVQSHMQIRNWDDAQSCLETLREHSNSGVSWWMLKMEMLISKESWKEGIDHGNSLQNSVFGMSSDASPKCMLKPFKSVKGDIYSPNLQVKGFSLAQIATFLSDLAWCMIRAKHPLHAIERADGEDGDGFEKAIDVLEESHKAHPSDAELTFRLARAYLERANFGVGVEIEKEISDRCVKLIRSILQATKKSEEKTTKQSSSIATSTSNAHVLKKTYVSDAYCLLGHIMHNKNDLEGAKRSFFNSIRMNPRDASAGNALSSVLLSEGSLDICESIWREVTFRAADAAWAWMKLGDLAISKRDFSFAAKCFSHCVRENLQDRVAWSHLGISHFHLEKFVASLRCFRKAIALSSGLDDHILEDYYIARCRMRLGHWNDALENLLSVLNRSSGTVDRSIRVSACLHAIDVCIRIAQKSMEEGLFAFGRKKVEFSLNLIDRFMREFSDMTETIPQEIISEMWKRKGDAILLLRRDSHLCEVSLIHAAIDAYKRWEASSKTPSQKTKSDFALAELWLSERLEDQCKKKDHRSLSISAATSAVEMNMFDASTWNVLGIVHDDFETKLRAFSMAARIHPTNWFPWLSVGLLALQEGKLASAAKFILHAQALDPENPLAWMGIGLVNELVKNGAHQEEAIDALKHASMLGKEPSFADLRLAHVSMGKSMFDIAACALRRYVSMEESDAEGWNLFGLALERIGHIEGAISAFKTCMKCLKEAEKETTKTDGNGDEMVKSSINLARTLTRGGHPDVALKIYQKLGFSNPIVMHGISEALYQKRDLKRSADFLIAAVKKTSGSHQLSLWLTLSRVYFCEKVLPMALETVNACCKKFPLSEEARVLRAEILHTMGQSENAETDLEEFIRTSKIPMKPTTYSKLLEILVDLKKERKVVDLVGDLKKRFHEDVALLTQCGRSVVRIVHDRLELSSLDVENLRAVYEEITAASLSSMLRSASASRVVEREELIAEVCRILIQHHELMGGKSGLGKEEVNLYRRMRINSTSTAMRLIPQHTD
eukprot:TRINITY_DN10827_c0_g1_i1.p1 TRINITY_DN10827_c0_g1~~TRINITY_DN10827_c0_g1_i1.p1  ORF type:complete len:1433 (-),score=432.51 TRINITY_DN10827_c0_g1_i1:105-4403(-)